MNKNVYINDVAAFLPNDPVSNEQMEAVLGQIGPKPSRARKLILRSNQIKSRHYAIDPKTHKPTHSNAGLTAEAIRQFAKRGRDINTIEMLSCGTSMPDQLMPNHTSMVHGELGIPPCETIATSGVCLSGTMALKYGYMSVLAGLGNNAVASGSEVASAIMRSVNYSEEIDARVASLEKNPEIAFEKDFLRWMLSDGAGAVWMSDKPNQGALSLRIDWIYQKSWANELDVCMYSGSEKQADGSLKGWLEFTPQEWLDFSIFSVKQDVKLLNAQVIEYTVTKPLQDLVAQGKVEADKIDWCLPHYSSGFFRDKVYAGMQKANCDISQDKWFTNLSTKGNTGSASIYIMLEELFHSGKLKPGEKILCYIPESSRFSSAFMHLSVV